jgi:hypothetical protein
MKNNLIVFGALGVGAYLLLKGKLGGGSERMFTLPNGQRVPESKLKDYGYVKYQGQWYLATDLQPPNVPQGTTPNSPNWINYVNAALQTGQQLLIIGGNLTEGIIRSIKSTAVDWNNSNVTVNVKYGYLTHSGVVNPTTVVNKPYDDQVLSIRGNGRQTQITLSKAGVVQKTATIDFYNEKLYDFDAGSVGITGIYIGSFDNIDTITPMYGIGSTYNYAHPKALTHCQDGTYSDSHKGACSYHGGAHEIKLRKGSRDYSGKGSYEHYASYRNQYKNKWAKQNRYSDRVTTI